MMKKQIAALVLGFSVTGGIGTGVLVNALSNETPAAAATDDPTVDQAVTTTATPKTTKTTKTPAAKPSARATTKPAPASSLVIRPGRVGGVLVGMSQAEAMATGYFNASTPGAVEGCPALPLTWKKAYADILDVMTLGNGEIVSIGVRGKLVRTAGGLGVGSTYAEVRAAIQDGDPVDAGYGQSGLFEYDPQTGGWIGYLFDPPAAQLTASDPVTFVEVTKGGRPDLMRDGC